MTTNLRADDQFVEDAGWQAAARRYLDFMESRKAKKALFLEAGTGWNTPGIIKYSFWQMTHDWPQATYACLNLGEAYAPEEIRDRSICINGDVGSVLRQL